MFFGGLWLIWLLWSMLPLIALIVALRARQDARTLAARVAELEMALAARAPAPPGAVAGGYVIGADPASGVDAVADVGPGSSTAPATSAAGSSIAGATGAAPEPVAVAPPWPRAPMPPPSQIEPPPPLPQRVDLTPRPPGPPPPAPPGPDRAPRLDLEQRIGARWATWVGVVAILFAASFLLRWAFEANLIGPGLRVTLGVIAGAALLGAGLALRRRRDVPYLSEGFSGGGLGILYLSLYAGYEFYGFLAPGPAFGAMFLVTLAGVLVAVLSGRQSTAVLSLLGGLLTPILLASDSPDERVLLGYLFVLDLSALAVARYRAWPGLNWLAWVGTGLLISPALGRDPAPLHLLARLALLSALFLLFLAVPLAREWIVRTRERDLDLILVVVNAAGYFGAIYWTLEATSPRAEAPYALALAVLYAAVAAESRRRVPDDEASPLIHLGIADVFLTIGIALTLDGPWVTLAWAAQGVVLLSAAPRVVTPAAVWGGLAALVLASARAAVFDPHWYPEPAGVLTPADVLHVAVVGCLVWGGIVARRVRPEQLRLLTPDGLRPLLWIIASVVAGVLIWRETTGLWPAALLAALALALGALARGLRAPRAPTFAVALPLVAVGLLVRLFLDDAELARDAATSLVNGALLLRVGACAALLVAGLWLARAEPQEGELAAAVGRVLGSAAGLALLAVLSLGWIDHQRFALDAATATRRFDIASAIRWRTRVGLSALWAIYAGVVLAWGFVRNAPAVRYAGLALLGVVVVKVFVMDLAAVATVYRVVSFLVLGMVLLAVSLAYQKARRTGP
jgi:uncharacterized membrane protein